MGGKSCSPFCSDEFQAACARAADNSCVRSLPGEERPNHGTQKGKWAVQNASPDQHREFLGKRRQMVVWLAHEGMFSHHALGFSYATEIVGEEGPVVRFLKVEILCDDDEVFLRYTGPGKQGTDTTLDMKGYNKVPESVIGCSINVLKDGCSEVWDTFGAYHQKSNNCQHFASQLSKLLKSRHGIDHPGSRAMDWIAPKTGKGWEASVPAPVKTEVFAEHLEAETGDKIDRGKMEALLDGHLHDEPPEK